MRVLITGDLHLTDAPRDAYRWELFRWLRLIADEQNVDAIGILGDVLDKKNRHSNQLLNRATDEIVGLRKRGRSVFVLRGNHDFDADAGNPALRWLDHVSGVSYVTEPRAISDKMLALPFERSETWRADLDKFPIVFMHQTFRGADMGDVEATEGLTLRKMREMGLADSARIYSGDIHVPQELYGSRVVYAGAPYPVAFNDSGPRRVLVVDEFGFEAFRVPSDIAITRATLRVSSFEEFEAATEEYGIVAGDQIKVELHLPRERFSEWAELKKKIEESCARSGVGLFGLALVELKRRKRERKIKKAPPAAKPGGVIETFAKEKNLSDDAKDFAKEIIEQCL